MNKKIVNYLIVTLCMTILGCVHNPHPHQPQASVPAAKKVTEPVIAPQPVLTAPAPAVVAPVAPVTNSAVDSLVKQSRAQYVARDYQNAIATAERGLRIDRRAADLYLVLAQSYLQLALPQKATMFVQQGLRYARQGSEAAEGLLRVQDIVQQSN